MACLESSSTSRALSAGGVGWDGSNVFDTPDLKSSTSKSSQSRLCARAYAFSVIQQFDGHFYFQWTGTKTLITATIFGFEDLPGVFVLFPPVALILMCTAVMPSSFTLAATSMAANMAAYGEASSLSALTFMPPVTRARVSRPDRSVTCYSS
jgi:hypothetical protein